MVTNPALLAHLRISMSRPSGPEILQIGPGPAGPARAGLLQSDENLTKFNEILRGAPCKICENYLKFHEILRGTPCKTNENL